MRFLIAYAWKPGTHLIKCVNAKNRSKMKNGLLAQNEDLSVTSDSHHQFSIKPVIFLFVIGAAIRLFASYFTFVINSDGVLYINQAKMIYYGQGDLLTSNGYSYLSNYPFFIACAYAIVGNWLVAAKSISFLFGFFTLVPLYLLFNRFFNRNISLLGCLIYALMPVFVDRSADIVRDPVYWFFMVTGIYFFILQNQERYRFYIFLSSISYLLATWARIEAILFIVLSSIYLLISGKMRVEKFLVFLSPVIIVTVVFILHVRLFDIDVGIINRTPEIVNKFTEPINRYMELRKELTSLHLIIPSDNDLMICFLPKVRHCVWLIGFGTLFHYFVEGFFPPFCLVLIIGFFGSREKFKKSSWLQYFCLLIFGGWLLLYAHLMHTWLMDQRFLAIVMFPYFIFVGFGLEKVNLYLQSRFRLKELSAFTVIFLIILSIGLAKNVQYRNVDKLVFRQIGELVAEREKNNDGYVEVLSSSDKMRQFAFYSNSNNERQILPQLINMNEMTGNSYYEFLEHLKQKKIKYLLWEEKYWMRQSFNIMTQEYAKHFKKLGSWYHSDTGKMILFEVKL